MIKLRQFVAFGLIATSLSSCATILGGPVNTYQRTKPLPGQPQREVRVGALVADILLVGLLGVGVDFATGAIYRPHPSSGSGAFTAPAAAASPAPGLAPSPAQTAAPAALPAQAPTSTVK